MLAAAHTNVQLVLHEGIQAHQLAPCLLVVSVAQNLYAGSLVGTPHHLSLHHHLHHLWLPASEHVHARCPFPHACPLYTPLPFCNSILHLAHSFPLPKTTLPSPSLPYLACCICRNWPHACSALHPTCRRPSPMCPPNHHETALAPASSSCPVLLLLCCTWLCPWTQMDFQP